MTEEELIQLGVDEHFDSERREARRAEIKEQILALEQELRGLGSYINELPKWHIYLYNKIGEAIKKARDCSVEDNRGDGGIGDKMKASILRTLMVLFFVLCVLFIYWCGGGMFERGPSLGAVVCIVLCGIWLCICIFINND